MFIVVVVVVVFLIYFFNSRDRLNAQSVGAVGVGGRKSFQEKFP